MITINGIGTKFLGFSKVEKDGTCFVTGWIVFLYLPIIPTSRYRILREVTKPNEFLFGYVSKERLVFSNILKTYLYGWLFFPILIFAPSFLCIREVADRFGIPPSKFKGIANPDSSFGMYEYLIVVAILWMLSMVAVLYNWDEKRGLPK